MSLFLIIISIIRLSFSLIITIFKLAVLELSERYQKRFGPLRYFVAGILKFLCLPKYNYELEYLPTSAVLPARNSHSSDDDAITAVNLFPDVMHRSQREGSAASLPRASSLSSIDSIMTPSRTSPEPSEIVRGLDPKIKRLSLGRSNIIPELAQVLRPSRTASHGPRTRPSKSTSLHVNEPRSSWVNDREEISSTISDPGPAWDSEPKWDADGEWEEEPERPIELPARPTSSSPPPPQEEVVALHEEERWVVKKGKFLGILVCNHSCRTVQSLSSQVVAPLAQHDDGSLDLLLVHGSGRLRLFRFFLRLQCGSHLSLPYVEYLKVCIYLCFTCFDFLLRIVLTVQVL